MKLRALLAAGTVALASVSATSTPAHAQADPFLGQLMLFGGNFCPRGWADASGQLLPINQNQALFSLLGTEYGGDGRTSFGLPDLRGRAPVSDGTGPGLPDFRLGSRGGSVVFTLTPAQMPSHTHTATIGASRTAGDTNQPVRNSFAMAPAGTNVYLNGSPAINNMHSNTVRVQNAGGGQSVEKVSPYLVLRWCIAMQGVFPSRN